jgi:threonyl-tRNA synthetase
MLKSYKSIYFDLDFKKRTRFAWWKTCYKFREAQTKKIPYQIVLGEKEVSENLITYRRYGSAIKWRFLSTNLLNYDQNRNW